MNMIVNSCFSMVIFDIDCLLHQLKIDINICVVYQYAIPLHQTNAENKQKNALFKPINYKIREFTKN